MTQRGEGVGSPADDFTAGGDEVVQAEFWNAGGEVKQGDAVIGVVTEFKEFQHTKFGLTKLAVLSPAVTRKNGVLEAFGSLAVIRTGFIEPRLTPVTLRKVVSLVYTHDEPSKKGSPMKCYAVVQFKDDAKLKEMLAKCGAEDLPF